ncbi:barstar family protein [Sphingomonas sp. GB1N7]|uniref:barstar family protein n=1 Tax=Parasphingomonas caseinilytica TaxID=3096158 RepID=UPI002FC5B99C
MNVVKLDARHWKTPPDFYNALLRKLGAPDWHGESIPALIDSMIVGDINEVTLPLRIEVTGLDKASEVAVDELIEAFSALCRYGAVTHITSDQASLEIADNVSAFLDDRP